MQYQPSRKRPVYLPAPTIYLPAPKAQPEPRLARKWVGIAASIVVISLAMLVILGITLHTMFMLDLLHQILMR